MAHALQRFRAGGLTGAVLQFVVAALRLEFDAPTRKRGENRERTGPLDVATMRDIGVSREYQDYASSAGAQASTARRLQCIAASARCGLPR